MITRGKKIWQDVGLAISFVVLAYHIGQYWFATDDAFISFRYARNLVHGYGLVFNVGEYVEGYSNFLWTILAGLGILMGFEPDTWANFLSTVASFVLVILVCHVAWRSMGKSRFMLAPAVALMYLCLNRSYAVWATGGLETRLFSLLVFAAVVSSPLFVNKPKTVACSSVLFALGALTRPEAFLFFGLVTLWFVIDLGRRGFCIKQLGVWLFPFLLMTGIHFVFRLTYYGYPFPNTFYAKVTTANFWLGLRYLLAYVLEYQLWLVAPVAILGLVKGDAGGRPLLKTSVLFVPYFFYLAYIGGDHFEYRPLDVFLPFLALSLGAGVLVIYRSERPWLKAIGSAIACVLIAFSAFAIPWVSHEVMPTRYEPEPTPADHGQRLVMLNYLPGFGSYYDYYGKGYRKIARHFCAIRAEEHRSFFQRVKQQADLLNEYIQEGILDSTYSLGLTATGTIPYYTGLKTIDCHGLTDAHVAHQAADSSESGRRLIAHEKHADWGYLESRRVDLIYSFNWGFFTPSEPRRWPLPDTYIVRLPRHYFSFRTTWTRDIVKQRFSRFPVYYVTSDETILDIN